MIGDIEYVITFEDKRFYSLVPFPVTSNSFNRTFPLQYLNTAKYRNDVPKGLKTN